MLEAVLKLLQAGGWVSIIGNKANSVQLQLQLPTGTELGKNVLLGSSKLLNQYFPGWVGWVGWRNKK